MPRKLNRHNRVRGAAVAGLLLTLAGAALSQEMSSAAAADTPKTLKDRVVLVSSEPFCIPVTVHPNRAISLGVGQLTITFSSDGKGGEDVVLVSRITKPQITLLKGTSTLTFCGTVPQLKDKQTGLYFASDFAIHFGSGNVTNIGTPDDSLVDTAGLAQQLKALHPSFRR